MKPPAVIITRFPYESSWGGEESHTLSIAKHLRAKGFEVIFFGSCPILLQKFSELSFPVRKVWGGKMVVTPFELLKSFFLFPLIKWNLIQNFKKLYASYDIKALYCLSLNEKILLTPEAIKQNIPVTWVEHQEIRNWLLKNPWKKMYQKLSSLVRIVPISNTNKQRLLSNLAISESNLVEITNGVDLEAISALRENTQKNLIVCANRFIPKKGIMDFLSTLPTLFSRYSNLEVMIIGEGEEENIMKEYLAKNLPGKNVKIVNFLKKEKWFEVLSRCDVFVSTARDSNETFSLNTAEALASGCKVVVTKCSGIADYLQDGVDAFIAEPNDPENLRYNIERALAAPDMLAENGIKTAREKFDQNKMLQQYESLILRS